MSTPDPVPAVATAPDAFEVAAMTERDRWIAIERSSFYLHHPEFTTSQLDSITSAMCFIGNVMYWRGRLHGTLEASRLHGCAVAARKKHSKEEQ